jgi:hypothetical protein
MKTELWVMPEGKNEAYSVMESIPSGSASVGERPYFTDGVELLKYLDSLVHPTAELRADWEVHIAGRTAFSVFL